MRSDSAGVTAAPASEARRVTQDHQISDGETMIDADEAVGGLAAMPVVVG